MALAGPHGCAQRRPREQNPPAVVTNVPLQVFAWQRIPRRPACGSAADGGDRACNAPGGQHARHGATVRCPGVHAACPRLRTQHLLTPKLTFCARALRSQRLL
jgi:hypothetical protein